MIISQAMTAFQSTSVASGTSAQQVQFNSTFANQGPPAGLAAGNFVLPIPAEFPVGYVPIRIKASGYMAIATTSTVAVGLTWGKTQASQAAMFTPVASASSTGANPPVFPTNVYPWAVEQQIFLDANSQTASAVGPGSGASWGATTGGVWFGAAVCAITAGVPPTQLTSVTFNATNVTEPINGINSTPTLAANCLFVGITFTNGTSDTTGKGQFVVTSFYAVAD